MDSHESLIVAGDGRDTSHDPSSTPVSNEENTGPPPVSETPDGGGEGGDAREGGGVGIEGNAPPAGDAAVPEKLADDVMKPPLWKRVLFRVIPALERIEERRILRANDRAYNKQFKYAENYVYTSKYNFITFLPKNLFEQFLRVANLYFLILLIIQVIPGVSAVPFYTTLVPLVGVLGVTLIKDGYDDIKRHISDYKVNHRIAHVLGPNGIVDRIWKQVRVGDIIRLEKDDFITADILTLSSSEPNSLVFIETAELDGETNLKVRQPLPETAELSDHHDKLATFNGEVVCEPPNNRLHKFVGTLDWNQTTYALDNDHIVLRGCRLRNTKWMYGLVIYAGHDTKLVQNSGRTKFKRTHLDRFMNRAVLMILGFLMVCVLICLIGSLIFEFVYGVRFEDYARYYNSLQDTPGEISFLQVLSTIIVLNTFVPISLYVSVETIRLGLSLLINWDLKMYYEPEDVPAIARSTALNEELGQIEYIFSDKTGTLTQNVMTFLKCTIRGVKHGEVQDKNEYETVVATGEKIKETSFSQQEPIDFTSWNKYGEKGFVYYDTEFLELCKSGDQDCCEFFKLLALCHTVLPSEESGELVYNAQSPDEAALVQAARNFGFVFKARSPFAITLDNQITGDKEEYEVLNILDFNNERKRMSVIVRHEDQITLYCKGADSVVFARLDNQSGDLKKKTLGHLADYAREGLRTLVVAKKVLTPEEYGSWAEEYHAASILQDNREQSIDIVYNKIEQNLSLIGATAIEDKLQDGVPETIANLAKADIKIWVLTGDKQETAINIGYSSKLLTGDMKVFVVDEDTRSGVIQQLKDADEAITQALSEGSQAKVTLDGADPNVVDDRAGLISEPTSDSNMMEPSGPPFGIVLNGHSLRHALREDVKLDLLETASKCSAVICCRVTPLQKKKVVDLVKKNKKAVTLAIGDGANDVGMIKAAHIGVGISGREGQQAVLASDYSFGQFRFLERLLLVHGRWSYHRMTTFLRYFFYKNFAFAFSQFIFAFFCGFTAQTLYDATYIAIYNVVYTSLPVVALAILDQDVDENNCYRHPKLYIAGQKNLNFTMFVFIRTLVKGIYVAIVLYFVLFGIITFNVFPNGYEWDYQSFGVAASCALTLIVNLQIALDTSFWNPIMHVFVWGSILIWFVVVPITHTGAFYSDFFTYGGVSFEVLSTANFWFYLPISSAVALLPTILFRLYQLYRHPTYVDFVRLKERKEGKKLFKRKLLGKKLRTHSARLTVSRTGYAFSHQEGFAHLINTGHIFGMNEENVAAEQLRRRSMLVSGGTSPNLDPDEPDAAPTAVATTKNSVPMAVITLGSGPVAVVHSSITVGVVEEVHSSVTVGVVEDPEVEVESAMKEAKEGEVRVPVSNDDVRAEKEHREVADTLMSHTDKLSPQCEEIELNVATSGTEGPSEETDSALMPSVRIPGLVDSPEDKGPREEGEGKGVGQEEAEGEGDEEEKSNLTPV